MLTSPLSEQYFNELGVKWAYQSNIPLAHFDVEASKRNQSRFRPLLEDVVDSYALAMLDGVQFPAVIAYERAGRYILLDGNQRLAAARIAELETLDAYVVEVEDSYLRDLLARTLNVRLDGQQITSEERIAHATYLVEKAGVSVQAAAARFYLRPGTLSGQMRAQEVRRDLEGQGIKLDRKMPETTLRALSPIKLREPRKQVALLIERARLGANEAVALCKEVSAQKSEADMLALLAKKHVELVSRQQHVGTNRMKRPWPLRSRLLATMQAVEKIFDGIQHPAQAELVTMPQIKEVEARFEAMTRAGRKVFEDAKRSLLP